MSGSFYDHRFNSVDRVSLKEEKVMEEKKDIHLDKLLSVGVAGLSDKEAQEVYDVMQSRNSNWFKKRLVRLKTWIFTTWRGGFTLGWLSFRIGCCD